MKQVLGKKYSIKPYRTIRKIKFRTKELLHLMQQEVLYKTTWLLDGILFLLNIVFTAMGKHLSIDLKQAFILIVGVVALVFSVRLSIIVNVDRQQSWCRVELPAFLVVAVFVAVDVALVHAGLTAGYYFLLVFVSKLLLSIVSDRIGKLLFRLCRLVAEFDYFDLKDRTPGVFGPRSFKVFLKPLGADSSALSGRKFDSIIQLDLSKGNFFIGANDRLLVIRDDCVDEYSPESVDFIEAHAKNSRRRIVYSKPEGWQEVSIK